MDMDPTRATCNFCMIADGATDELITNRSQDGDFIVIVPREHQHPDERLIIPIEHARDAAENPELYARTQQYAAEYIQANRRAGVRYVITSDVTPLRTGGVLHVHARITPHDEAGSDVLRKPAPLTMP